MKTGQCISKMAAPTASMTPRPSSNGLAEHIQISLAAAQSGPAASADKMKKRIRLLLVDDHPVVRKGISACLSQQTNVQIIGEAADGQEALRKARELGPDIVLMDIDMP